MALRYTKDGDHIYHLFDDDVRIGGFYRVESAETVDAQEMWTVTGIGGVHGAETRTFNSRQGAIDLILLHLDQNPGYEWV